MNVLVLGGTGFIGRFIVEQLIAKNLPVTVLTRNPKKMTSFTEQVRYITGDLLHYDALDLTPYTCFINCAGELHNEDLMPQLHVESILGLLHKVVSLKDAQWIQISSVGVYGKMRAGLVTEDFPFVPVGQYEKTKAKGEAVIKDFCLGNNINYTIIRPSNVFGCGMPNQSIEQLVAMVKRKLFFFIGKNTDQVMMNYVPVEDVAYLVVNCINNKNALNQDFIVSDELPIKDFVSIICLGLKIKNSFYHIPEFMIRSAARLSKIVVQFPVTDSRVDALTTQAVYSTAKAKQTLGYNAPVGLTRGLKNYVTNLYKS